MKKSSSGDGVVVNYGVVYKFSSRNFKSLCDGRYWSYIVYLFRWMSVVKLVNFSDYCSFELDKASWIGSVDRRGT